jgi:hypothetical protein
VWALQLHGRAYAAHHDPAAGALRLHRLYRDASALQREVAVGGGPLELSVADEALLVHDLQAGRVAVVDVAAGGGGGGGAAGLRCAPMADPRPLGVSDDGAAFADGASTGESVGGQGEGEGQGGRSAAAASPGAEEAARAGAGGADGARFQQHAPDWLLDVALGRVLRLRLDLSAIAADTIAADVAGGAAGVLAFLQRRRASAAPRRDPRRATLAVLRRLAARRAPPGELRPALDAVLAAFAEARRLEAQRQHHHPGVSPGVSPEEVALAVLAPLRLLHAAVPQQANAAPHQQQLAYLRAALAALAASCHALALPFPPPAAVLYVEAVLEQGAAHQVAPLLGRLAPLLDSPRLVAWLEESEAGGRLPRGTQLALDMRRRLGDVGGACAALVGEGAASQALRQAHMAQRRGEAALPPEAWLAAAGAGGDALLFAAAYRVVAAQATEPPLLPLCEAAARHAAWVAPAALQALLR